MDANDFRFIVKRFDHAPSDAELFEHGTPDKIQEIGGTWYVTWWVPAAEAG